MTEELSVSEKVKLAAQFIADSPPGEFHEVLNDVRVLVNDDAKLQEGAKSAICDYNMDKFIVTTLLDERKAIVSKYGRIDDQHFYDPRTNKKFRFDHVLQKAEGVEDYTHEGSNADLRASIEGEVSKYIDEHYEDGFCSVYDYEGKIVIVSECGKYNPTNFWNGRWLAEWTFDPSSKKLSGSLKFEVHYFEDGNVQLRTHNSPSETVSGNSKEDVAVSIAEKMKQTEAKYQESVNESFVELSENTFKHLRRALPITKSKLEWHKILGYKLGADMSNK